MYTGSFNRAMKYLATTSTKASIKIFTSLGSSEVFNSELYIKVFDAAVKPLAQYRTHIWGEQIASLF